MSTSSNNRQLLEKMQKKEEQFDSFMNNLKTAQNNKTNLTNKDLKNMVIETFTLCDGLRDTTVGLIDEWDSVGSGSSKDGNNITGSPSPPILPTVEINSPVTSMQEPATGGSSQKAAASNNSAVDTEIESTVVPLAAGPVSAADEDSPAGPVLAMLDRMTRSVQGFFQWLKTKVQELASWAWNKVREAFSAMVDYLQRLSKFFSHHASYSKMHTA